MTSTAKEIGELKRTFAIDGDVLGYELWMAAVRVALSHHLTAELRRQPDGAGAPA